MDELVNCLRELFTSYTRMKTAETWYFSKSRKGGQHSITVPPGYEAASIAYGRAVTRLIEWLRVEGETLAVAAAHWQARRQEAHDDGALMVDAGDRL